jgi:hypothetical protein
MALVTVPTITSTKSAMVQIATGSCSGATVTITGLGGYDYYNVVFEGIRTGSSSTNPDYYLRINGDSSSNYLFAGHSNYTAQSATGRSGGDSSIILTPGINSYRQNGGNLWNIRLDNCNSNGFITYSFVGVFPDGSTQNSTGTTLSGVFKVASNLSSLVLSMTSGSTYDQGTYYIYGGKN